MNALTQEQLAQLAAFSTPSLSNAIEVFNVRPRNVGYMDPSIRCLGALQKPMVGYAVTGRIRSAAAPAPGTAASRGAFWKWMMEIPAPRVVVLQDLDDPPAVGSFWGEVTATVYGKLGCAGTVTNPPRQPPCWPGWPSGTRRWSRISCTRCARAAGAPTSWPNSGTSSRPAAPA